MNVIDLEIINSKINLVKSQLYNLKPQLTNKTSSLYEPHVEYLRTKLARLADLIQSFEHNRNKRGLIDGLGSIIKSISGNLDSTDAIKYNNAIKVLQNNEHKLESELIQQISLSKEWTLQNSHILDNITKNQEEIHKVLKLIISSESNRDTDLVKYAHMAQYLLILSDNIDSLSEEFHKLENTLAFIRASSTPHSILRISELIDMLGKLRVLYFKDEILDIDLRNYYDVMKTGYYYASNKIVIAIKIPIAYQNTYSLYRLSIIPNKNNLILIPTLPFIAISGKDSMYIETECPKVNEWYLCQEDSRHSLYKEQDCIQHLIVNQELSPTCNPTRITLKRTALEQLDDAHYTINFPNTTRVKISCGQEQYKSLQGSFLVTIPAKCYLQTPDITISNSNDHLKGHPIKITEIPTYENSAQNEEITIQLNSIDLEKLHAANMNIMSQHTMKLDDSADSSIYHTTIPIYVILSVATIAIIIGLVIRRVRSRHLKNPDTEEVNIGIYAEIPKTRRINPHQIKVDHCSIPATLSTKVSK